MYMHTGAGVAVVLAAAVTGMGSSAAADSIAPASFTTSLDMGESVTIQKTVVVEASGTTSALIDAHFLVDTSGSMGGAITAAKTGANDILNALSSFGDLASGVGVFSERALLTDAIRSDINTDRDITTAAINAVTLGDPDGGGDYPESGNTAIELAAGGLTWRTGSNRFLFVVGDAPFKGSPDADVIAALNAEGVTLVGLNFGGSDFQTSVEELGGEVYASTTDPDDLVAAISAGIVGGFADYESVTIDDLDGGGSLIDVSVACTGADIGACAGDAAIGDFDRSVDRTFTFDVTFTRTGEGHSVFDTFALVDGGIVAREGDIFPDASPIPLPATGLLLLGALGGMGGLSWRNKRKSAAA